MIVQVSLISSTSFRLAQGSALRPVPMRVQPSVLLQAPKPVPLPVP
jgi:hypothetical protein